MVKVLVVGANGYIGGAIAVALAQQGHQVWGLIRKKDEAATLAKNEITPLVAEVSDSKALEPVIDQVSIVIDTAPASFGASGPSFAHNKALITLLEASAAKSGNRKRYVYTSGILVYNDSPKDVLTEDADCKGSKMQFRADFDREVIKNTKIEGVVVRPGWVYGVSFGNYLHGWFKGNDKGEIEIPGNPNKIWGWIHIWDLASLYVGVVEANHSAVAGEIFNGVDETRSTVGQIKEAFARANGVQGKVVHVAAGTDPFSQACEVTVVCSNEKAKRVLNWKSKHGPLLDYLPRYVTAYKAHLADKAPTKAGH